MMKLSISNIAWDASKDEEVYNFMRQAALSGVEIAPTRIFPDNPYEQLKAASLFKEDLKKRYCLDISSMQSIWFGKKEKMFSSDIERGELLKYTKAAIEFADALECKNLVFGCPKNRVIEKEEDYDTAVRFFYQLGEFAAGKNTVLALEANPVIYGTNFMNTTMETIEVVKRVSSKGCKVNLDTGAILYNQESLELLRENMDLINHIHISEPQLAMLEKRELHRELADILRGRYQGYISIEMGKRENIQDVYDAVDYVREVFNGI